ncbi:MAG TPA: hypothetical protein VMS93_04710 [Candidatus Saccharimonadales bacterium]|nr:hypothetical protein [Candidatus Saccharimonadales bacterium]
MAGAAAAVLAGILAAGLPGAARAQEPPPPRWQLGGSLILGVPAGEFKNNVGDGGGIVGRALWRPGQSRWLKLQLDAGVLIYGAQTQVFTLDTGVGLARAEFQTTNSIAMFSVGPRIEPPSGTLRPHLDLGVGLGYFFTQSSLNGYGAYDQFSTTDMSSAALSWSVGGGLALHLAGAERPVLLDLSVLHRSHGQVQYLPRGGITDNGDGTVTYHPAESKADLVLVELGVTFGLK